MLKRIAMYIAAGALALCSACATTTGGPTFNGTAVSKIIGQNVLMNDPGILALYATNNCGVAAAQEYRLSILACTGQFAALAGGAIIPANVVSGINDLCQVMGYDNASNQLIVSPTITVGPLTTTGACMPNASIATANLPPLKRAVN